MDDAERARLSSDVFEDLARIVHRTAQDTTAILRRHGLNVAQWQLLRTLHENPGVTQAWLVQHRGVTPGGVSLLVSKVEEAGLLTREADGASNRLRLTRKGESLVARLLPDQESFFVHRFGALNEQDLRRLHRLTSRVLDGLPDDE
jgi:DNA-binding MarR family transcriptional regulator